MSDDKLCRQIYGSVLAVLITSGLNLFADAGTLYKWVDEQGNIIYQDTPPPSGVDYEQRDFNEPGANTGKEVSDQIESAANDNPISFYSVPDCAPCDLVRLYLDNHTIPFAEKDVEENVSHQKELEEKTGQLRVPAVMIGDLVIDGYSKSALKQGLIEKGYPVEKNTIGGPQRNNGEDRQERENY